MILKEANTPGFDAAFDSAKVNMSDNRRNADNKPELKRDLDAALKEQIKLLPAIASSFLHPLHRSCGPSAPRLTRDLHCELGIRELEYRLPLRTQDQGE